MKSLGIDLGTTNCVAAYADEAGLSRTVVNFEGDVLTPSAVLFEADRLLLVGREAVKQAAQHPEAYCECFKRRIGSAANTVQVQGKSIRAELLSAVLLTRLKRDFERTLGEARDVVITVPAFFDEARRRATWDAGRIAGWQVTDIINEPTAAAIGHARQYDHGLIDPDRLHRVLIYDLGGGTFDCTLMEIAPGREYRTVATDGEVHLGGVDWDARLAHYLQEEFEKRTGTKLEISPTVQATLLRTARQMKHSLSTRTKTDAPLLFGGKRTIVDVSRETFQTLTRDLLERTRVTTRLLLEAGRCRWEEIDQVILVGGSSRMPMVAEMLRAESGREISINPAIDEAVARGAALYSYLLNSGSPVRVINVNSHSLRIAGRRDGRPSTSLMIPRNSPLPSSKAKLFPLTHADQTSFSIKVCEGELDDPEGCEPLGTVVISDLPRSPCERPWKVAVTLRYRADGCVEVAAQVRDPREGERVVKDATATLTPSRGLTPGEIEKQRQILGSYEIG